MDEMMNENELSPETSENEGQKPTGSVFAPKAREFSSEDVMAAGELYSMSDRSVAMDICRIAGMSIAGALPGFIIWLLIGKVGFFAIVGALFVACGAVLGCRTAMKKCFIDEKYGIMILAAVVLIIVFIGTKIVWCWELMDLFTDAKKEMRNNQYVDVIQVASAMTDEQVDKAMDKATMEVYGFTEGTFGEFFSNFTDSLNLLNRSTQFYVNLLLCLLAASIGGTAVYKKYGSEEDY